MNRARPWLLASGWASIAAALGHVACIVGGTRWYLFMGAPPQLVRAAERGEGHLALVTALIAAIIFVWAAYAFSAAGVIKRLPFARLALVAISIVLVSRGLSYFVFPFWSAWRPDLPQSFLIWSSLITLIMGLCFAIGTWRAWPQLSQRM